MTTRTTSSRSPRPSIPQIVVEPTAPGIELESSELDDIAELDLEDIEEIPLPAPRILGHVAAEALAATPLFSGLSQEALESLVAELQLIQLADGEVLFHEGDPGDALYVIVEGEVSVQAEGPPRVEMARLGPGSFIGEVALMTDQPRSATVTAVGGGAELLRIDRAHVEARARGARRGALGRAALRPRSPRRSLDAHEPAVSPVRFERAGRRSPRSSSSSRSMPAA